MKIVIDDEKCVAAGQCCLAAPQVFDQRDEDGIAFLLDNDPPDDSRADVEDAIELCPARAISME